MRPQVNAILGTLAAHLITEVAPHLSIDYLQKNTALVSMMLMLVAEEWDRAAERRVRENRELRHLLSDSAPSVSAPELRSRLEAVAGQAEESLILSELDRTNDELRTLLIELHAHVEEQPGQKAQEIEARIWRELRTSTERRALSMDPF